ncbi:hypothetical protein M1P56_03345 [Streptomyces sp. HU2014]|uniref:hypothetical protein n=1 Tax=Streptomyces sp. HU2014 TaxID=2939414 RepID=UPI00200E3ED8|nr:hypothetical protein [Streptomyces sp. HU2014]UQI43479.1 hypothetical protein M1P56_03345 [Streptomyces sp. HU2014]
MKTSRIATIVAAGVLVPAAFLAAPATAAERTPSTATAEQQSTAGRAVIKVGTTSLTVKPGGTADVDVTVDNSASDTDFGGVGLPTQIWFDGKPGPEWNDVKVSFWNEEKHAWVPTGWDPSNEFELPYPRLDKRSTVGFKLRFAFSPDVQPGQGVIQFTGLSMDMEKGATTDQATWPAEVKLPFTVLPADR